MQHVQVVFQQLAFFCQRHFNLFAGQHADEHAAFALGSLGSGLFTLALGGVGSFVVLSFARFSRPVGLLALLLGLALSGRLPGSLAGARFARGIRKLVVQLNAVGIVIQIVIQIAGQIVGQGIASASPFVCPIVSPLGCPLVLQIVNQIVSQIVVQVFRTGLTVSILTSLRVLLFFAVTSAPATAATAVFTAGRITSRGVSLGDRVSGF